MKTLSVCLGFMLLDVIAPVGCDDDSRSNQRKSDSTEVVTPADATKD
ncbi:MAG: hypothetical protein MJZ35_08680 [Bacteroidaceae bacterium]|nr:hypothetical protein [Bacteroidaceae bacterium]